MSIASEITRLQTAKADLKTAIEGKGVTVPSATLLDGYADLVDAIQTGGGGLSEVTLASTATSSQGVVELILAGITIQSDHMYIMSIKNKTMTDWVSDQFIAGAYSDNGGKTGLRYRNSSPTSIPINNSYDAKNEIGDTYVFADVLMWGAS